MVNSFLKPGNTYKIRKCSIHLGIQHFRLILTAIAGLSMYLNGVNLNKQVNTLMQTAQSK